MRGGRAPCTTPLSPESGGGRSCGRRILGDCDASVASLRASGEKCADRPPGGESLRGTAGLLANALEEPWLVIRRAVTGLRASIGRAMTSTTASSWDSNRTNHSPAVCSCVMEPPAGKRSLCISGTSSAAKRFAFAHEKAPNNDADDGPNAARSVSNHLFSSIGVGATGSKTSCSQGGVACTNRWTTRRLTPPARPSRPAERCCKRCSILRKRCGSVMRRPPSSSENLSTATFCWLLPPCSEPSPPSGPSICA